MATTIDQTDETTTKTWQKEFMKMLPRIKRQARTALMNMDAEAREDALSEVVANAMCAYKRLHERGELERAFISALARYAVAQYHDGRRVGTSQNSGDVYSVRAKRKGDYEMVHLGAPGKQVGEWMECLHDNRVTPVPDQVAFRLDFPKWLEAQTTRDKQIAERLSIGFSTAEVAVEFGVSHGRISQLRRELANSWYEFISSALD